MFTHEILSELSELELSIYNCILRHRENIGRMKIKELADEAHVSTATVLRFCRKMGCEGYAEFKLRYKEHLEKEKIILGDTGETAFRGFLLRMGSRDFRESIEKALAILRESRWFVFIGSGFSGILAKYGARYFSNMGYFSFYIGGPWPSLRQTLEKRTAVIVLSESGSTQDTIRLASQMKEQGGALIAITNHPGSALSRISDCSITYHVPSVISDETNFTTQVPVLFTLELLAKKLYIHEGEKDGQADTP